MSVKLKNIDERIIKIEEDLSQLEDQVDSFIQYNEILKSIKELKEKMINIVNQ